MTRELKIIVTVAFLLAFASVGLFVARRQSLVCWAYARRQTAHYRANVAALGQPGASLKAANLAYRDSCLNRQTT